MEKLSPMLCVGVLAIGLTIGPNIEGYTGMGLMRTGEVVRTGVGGIGLITGPGAEGKIKGALL